MSRDQTARPSRKARQCVSDPALEEDLFRELVSLLAYIAAEKNSLPCTNSRSKSRAQTGAQRHLARPKKKEPLSLSIRAKGTES